MQKGWRSLWNEKRSPTITYFPIQLLLFYGLRHVISSQTSMQYHSHNFKQPIRSRASKWGTSSEYQVEITVVVFDLTFSYNNKNSFRDLNPHLGGHNTKCQTKHYWRIVLHCGFLNQPDSTTKFKGYHSLISPTQFHNPLLPWPKSSTPHFQSSVV